MFYLQLERERDREMERERERERGQLVVNMIKRERRMRKLESTYVQS